MKEYNYIITRQKGMEKLILGSETIHRYRFL